MERLQHHWYRLTPLHLILYPISLILRTLVALRRTLYLVGIFRSVTLPVPVVVVGNISVGGTGKTPLTLWLAQQLLEAGWHPAIISRGYRKSGSAANSPREVNPSAVAQDVGDEPLLMRQRNLCPVWIGQNRPAVAQALLNAYPECDIVLSDDGLQHYRLHRDVEIAVIDGKRRFGNGMLIPAGPLREPITRLQTVDAIVVNGGDTAHNEYLMQLVGIKFYNLLNPDINANASQFKGLTLHACAGIGHPQRFFLHLKNLGLDCISHPFPDHHQYSAGELDFEGADAVFLTEKDAVKCAAFANEKFWVLRVEAQVDSALAQLIIKKVTS